jgi:DNA-binding beta-propeller fold protein YncE
VMVTGLAAAITTSAAASAASGHPVASRPASAVTAVGQVAQQPRGTKLWLARYYGGDHYAQPAAMAVSPGGSQVFVTGFTLTSSSSRQATATVAYDATSGKKLWVRNSDCCADAVVASPDGSKVFITGHVTVAYDAATGARLWAQPYPGALGAYRAAVSPDGEEMYVTGPNGSAATTIAYRVATGTVLWTRSFPSGNGPGGLMVSPDGSTVFVAATDADTGSLQTVAYDAATGSQQWVQRTPGPFPDNSVSGAAISPDGSQVFVTGSSNGATNADEGTVTVAYNAATGATQWVQARVTAGAEPHPVLAVSPDGSAVYIATTGTASGRFTETTTAYDAATGATHWMRTFGTPAQDHVPTGIAVSPDGSSVYVVGYDNNIFTLAYGAASGNLLWTSSPRKGEGIAVAVDPLGTKVFITGLGFLATPPGAASYVTVAYTP